MVNKFKNLINKILKNIVKNNDINLPVNFYLEKDSVYFNESDNFVFNQIDLAITTQNFNKIEDILLKNPSLLPYFNEYKSHNRVITYKDIITPGKISDKEMAEGKFKINDSDFVLTRENHIEVFLKHINVENFFNLKKVEFLKKMHEDSIFLAEILSPLKKLGIGYTIDLTGGCVRDFVLNKAEEIKDLDVMISLPFGDLWAKWNLRKSNILEAECFTEKELDAISWNDDDSDSVKKENLIILCLNRTTLKKEIFSIKNRIQSALRFSLAYGVEKKVDTKNRLISVIKLDKANNHYPIDILLTDFIKPEFLNDFDFNICKASICIKNNYMKLDTPEHYSVLLSRFNALNAFWFDVYHKRITYDSFDRSEYDLQSSFGKIDGSNQDTSHFSRIQKKYPDYKLLVVHDRSLNIGERTAPKMLESIKAKYELEQVLPEKPVSTKKPVFKC